MVENLEFQGERIGLLETSRHCLGVDFNTFSVGILFLIHMLV